MASAVTPGQVAPPFETTGATHGGAKRVGTASRPVAGSQAGLGSSAGAAAAAAAGRRVRLVVAGGRAPAAIRPLGATGPLVTVSGSASTAGAGPRRGRATRLPGRGRAPTADPLPPPRLPAAPPS